MNLANDSEIAVCAGMTGDELVRATRSLSTTELAICAQMGLSPAQFLLSKKLGGVASAWNKVFPRRSAIIDH